MNEQCLVGVGSPGNAGPGQAKRVLPPILFVLQRLLKKVDPWTFLFIQLYQSHLCFQINEMESYISGHVTIP